MKKIIGLIFLVFLLTSCLESQVVDKIEKKENIEEKKVIDKNKEIIEKKEEKNIQGIKKMENDRLSNQIIIKDYSNGLVLKQDTKGFMHNELGSTILYLDGKELISLSNDLATILCDINSYVNLCEGDKITDKLIRERVAKKFEILKNSELEIDKNSNIKVLYIWEYETKHIYFIDLKNKKIIKNESGIDFFVKKIKQGKDGTFIMGKDGRGCSGGLFFIDNNFKKRELFKNNCDFASNNIPNDYQEIINFELIGDEKVKIFYKGENLEEKEKIVNL